MNNNTRGIHNSYSLPRGSEHKVPASSIHLVQ